MWLRYNNISAWIIGILDAIISITVIGLLIVVIAIVHILDWVWGDSG